MSRTRRIIDGAGLGYVHQAAVVVVGADHRPIELGQPATFGDGDTITVTANPDQESRSPQMDVLILGGRVIGFSGGRWSRR